MYFLFLVIISPIQTKNRFSAVCSFLFSKISYFLFIIFNPSTKEALDFIYSIDLLCCYLKVYIFWLDVYLCQLLTLCMYKYIYMYFVCTSNLKMHEKFIFSIVSIDSYIIISGTGYLIFCKCVNWCRWSCIHTNIFLSYFTCEVCFKNIHMFIFLIYTFA